MGLRGPLQLPCSTWYPREQSVAVVERECFPAHQEGLQVQGVLRNYHLEAIPTPGEAAVKAVHLARGLLVKVHPAVHL